MLRWAKPLVLLFAILLIPVMAFADPVQFGGYGGLSLGGIYMSFDGINDYLEPADVDSISNVLPTVGGTGTAIIFGRILIGGRGSIFQQHLPGNDVDVDLSGSYGFLNIGYAVFNTDRWIFAPVAGIGGASVRMDFDGNVTPFGLAEFSQKYDDRQPDAAVDDSLAMTTAGGIGHIGLTCLYQFRFVGKEQGGFGALLLGISGGYMFEISRTGWEIEGDNVRNGPDINLCGAYLNLEINFGGGTASTLPGNEYGPKVTKEAQEKSTKEPLNNGKEKEFKEIKIEKDPKNDTKTDEENKTNDSDDQQTGDDKRE